MPILRNPKLLNFEHFFSYQRRRLGLGSKRSQQRMREIEAKLCAGMTANGFPSKTQDQIVKFISSFALYDFPESHASSFALIAYASAFLKVRYLAAFTAALLNNWPMGFYHPATIVKDAQRHGPSRIRHAVEIRTCDALLLKVNQIGTLTEALAAYEQARAAGRSITLSVRSDETEDNWAADLSTGWGADQFKNGSIRQSERLAKYNRLLEIAEDTKWPLANWPHQT